MENRHGGNLDFARQEFPQVMVPWIDLSTGINPFPYPIASFDLSLYHALPSSLHEERVREVAADHYGCLDSRYVALASGTQILISLIPYWLPAREVCILCPTYSEYESSWQQKGVVINKVSTMSQFMDCAWKREVVGVICNPNNPDGRFLDRVQMEAMIRIWDRGKNYLILDEAYMDFVGPGMASSLPSFSRLVILRSLGKAYGLAGLRVGFLLAQPEIVQKVQKMLGSWPVSGPALQITLQALQDIQWLARVKRELWKQQDRLEQLCMRYSLHTVGKTALFRLIRHEQANALWRHLALQGIWVRRFEYDSTWLRLGMPSSEQDWQRLEKAFHSYFTDGGSV